ncbi:MAG: hypothetical protein AB8B96_01510 [Lysobacterales bacterium]
MLCCLTPAWTHAQGTAVKLNGPLVDGGDVSRHFLSPNSDRVLYTADQNENGVSELYSVPISGGLPIQLTGPLSGDRDVRSDVRITPDGSHAVFLGDLEIDGVTELFSVPIDGGPVIKLNDPLPAGGNINSFDITPDSSRVIYSGEQTSNGLNELFSVPVAGGTVTRLNDPLTGGDRVLFNRVISPDSSTVIFIADQNGDRVDELYAVPVAGGVVTKLNGPLVDGGDVSGADIGISADGSTVIYVADQDVVGVEELYSVPIIGGVSTKISGPLASDRRVFNFQIGADSRRVVYLADQDTNGLSELFSVPIGGGAVTKLSDPEAGDLFDYLIAASGAVVVYTSNNAADALFSVPVVGGPVTQLSAPLDEGEAVGGFELSADTNTVVYTALPAGDVSNQAAGAKGRGPVPTALFSVPVMGGLAIRLTEPFFEGGSVPTFVISNDGDLVVYQANQDDVQVFELFGVPTRGGTAVKLSAPLIIGGNVRNPIISLDSSRITYLADQDIDGANELFSLNRGGLGRLVPLFSDGFE